VCLCWVGRAAGLFSRGREVLQHAQSGAEGILKASQPIKSFFSNMADASASPNLPMSVATHTTTRGLVREPVLADLIDFSDDPVLNVEDEWRKRILPDWQNKQHDQRVHHLVHLGVPSAVQGELWFTGLSPSDDESSFERAADKANSLRRSMEWDWDGSRKKALPWSELLIVTADVPRTWPDEQRTGELNAAALEQTLDALVASAVDGDGSGRRRGYVQGLADVAAVLLMHGQPPWQAFGCLRALSSRPLLQPLLALDAKLWEAIGHSFTLHLEHNLPQLSAHFDELGLLPSFYLPEWLVPLWCRSLAPEATVLVLNLILIEGDLSLLRAALAVVSALAPQLLVCDDLSDCRRLLASGCRTLSVSTFRACLLSCAVEPAHCTALAPWFIESPTGVRTGFAPES